ncbi:MAG TPA: adenylate/guanylate cyclase domain-containing protein [Phototrophicaceae bacterium]|nr:adenylate/guanylate cyclase domain-containing protein [Phototrophicaceae bacterium]
MANQDITDRDPYSEEQLSMYFDPFIYKHIRELKLDGVNINKFIIVFWDISKFSGLIKELKVLMKKRMKKHGLIFHELEYLLRDYYSEATRVITKNDGILDKFIGDGIFCYFGYQDKKFDTVYSKAMDAALELKTSFIEIKDKHMKILHSHYDYKPSTNINLKCAMHIGQVLFGYWHSPLRSQITAIGDDVNFCSRLEGYADSDQIIISKELNNALRKTTNNAFRTKKIKIPEDKKLKTYEHVKYVYELIGRNNCVQD